jgi:hypothetical protein
MLRDLHSAPLMSLVLALALAGCTSAPGARATAEPSDDNVAGAGEAASERARDVLEPPDFTEGLTDWMESPWCGQRGYGPDATWKVYPCADGVPEPDLSCGDAAPRPPLWSRTRETPEDAWSDWQLRSDWYCAADLPARVHGC